MTEQKKALAALFPIAVEVRAGETCNWCGCGLSSSPPFCDRKDCGDKCMQYTARYSETLLFCNCKQTKEPPLCDGSHADLVMNLVRKGNENAG